MEEETKQLKPKKDYKTYLAIFLTFFLTGLIAGGLAFFYGFKKNIGLEKQIDILKGEIIKLEQKNDEMEDEARKLSSQLEQYKQNINLNTFNINTECDFPEGCDFYMSDKFGVKFYYRKGGIIEEDDNILRLLLPAGEEYSEKCGPDTNCKIIDGKPCAYDAGTIELFRKEQEETIQNAIFDIIKKAGVQVDNCTVKEVSREDGGLARYVVNSNIAIAADKELEDENWMHAQGDRQQKLNELCSVYANGDLDESLFPLRYFLYDDAASKTNFIFLSGTGMDAPFFIPESIEFME